MRHTAIAGPLWFTWDTTHPAQIFKLLSSGRRSRSTRLENSFFTKAVHILPLMYTNIQVHKTLTAGQNLLHSCNCRYLSCAHFYLYIFIIEDLFYQVYTFFILNCVAYSIYSTGQVDNILLGLFCCLLSHQVTIEFSLFCCPTLQ